MISTVFEAEKAAKDGSENSDGWFEGVCFDHQIARDLVSPPRNAELRARPGIRDGCVARWYGQGSRDDRTNQRGRDGRSGAI